jgi:hypothetical protein
MGQSYLTHPVGLRLESFLRQSERLEEAGGARSSSSRDLSDQIECFGVTRIETLAKLATIRQVPLLKLMDDLGIQSPGIR